MDLFPFTDVALSGEHQFLNAGLATALLRHQTRVRVSEEAILAGAMQVKWPARMQWLSDGPLTALTPDQSVTLDGGHNRSAGEAMAKWGLPNSRHLILGMLTGKDPAGLTGPLGDQIRTLQIVPVPGHDSHPASAFGPEAVARADLEDALLNVPSDEYPILIAGSLYLAGEALRLNDEVPD